MSSTTILIGILAVIVLFKLIKEMMYIRLYAFIIRLQSEGKLMKDSDPHGIADKVKNDLKNNSSKYI